MKPDAKFISFEGIDGCGKSTLLDRLCAWLDESRIPHITTREPGGTLLGESIRRVLLDPAYHMMDAWAEVFLYTASRAQLVREVIKPALQDGVWVVADRFIDATLAYQGYGRRLDVQRLRQIQAWASDDLWPDHTVLLDCDVHVALERLRGRLEVADRMELQQVSFHQRVRQGYLELAQAEPQRFVILNGEKPLTEVVQDLLTLFWHPYCHRSRQVAAQ